MNYYVNPVSEKRWEVTCERVVLKGKEFAPERVVAVYDNYPDAGEHCEWLNYMDENACSS